jgi:uncharacterized protein
MKNPFWTRELPLTAPFCNRTTELKALISHARNRANIVMFSPRRYGKTSLVKRVQQALREHGTVAVYVDFFGVGSVDEAAARLVTQVYSFCHGNEGLFRRAMKTLSSWKPVLEPDPDCGLRLTVRSVVRQKGSELLEETMSNLGRFIGDQKQGVHIALDEFQEVTELAESRQIQGIMRSHIQTHSNASYFFVGSRRRVLHDIFNSQKAPFYKSAINYPLERLPAGEAADFIVEQFARGGKKCPEEIALRIVEKIRAYPYYVQKIPYSIFDASERKAIGEKEYTAGLVQALEEEKTTFEGWLGPLSPRQISALAALAEHPTDQPYAFAFLSEHNIGNAATVRKSMEKLLDLDYIERENGVFQVTDPLFALWLKRSCVVGQPLH